MTNYLTGHQAEQTAADFLAQHGFTIIELNWKTRYCEIDVVAKKAQTIYLVEVKFRSGARQGTGLDYITAKKLKQMAKAAELWISHNNWHGQYQLAVVSIDGTSITFLDQVY